jgi:glycosyltransferase involved in cell wall biosynthesis
VLQIIGTLALGGAEKQVADLTLAMSNAGNTVSVCCLGGEGILAEALRAKGIQVYSINLRLRYLPVSLYKLYRLIKRLSPHVVHTHLYHAGIWGRLVAKWAGVPVILTTEHGMNPWKTRFQWLLEGLLNPFTDKIIAVSEEIRQCHMKRQGIPPVKIVTIPNGVNVECFTRLDSRDKTITQLGFDPSTFFVGSVARLARPKRLDELLLAARLVCNNAPHSHFLFIGDGPLRQELEDQASQLGLTPNSVTFLGSRADIPDLLQVLDIFVLSSETEGLPISLLEALAATRPVVATRVGGIPEIIKDGVNGLLVSPHDPKGLAESIQELMRNEDLRRSLAVEGYRTVETSYSIKVIARKILALYELLLQEKNTTHAT